MWSLYLLYNNYSGYTYIGCTTDPDRRLRQHRREIKGGARSTAKNCKSWRLCLVLSGFANRSEAMRWEKIIKLRCRGFAGRVAGFKVVSMGKCPYGSYRNPKMYDPPKGLILEVK